MLRVLIGLSYAITQSFFVKIKVVDPKMFQLIYNMISQFYVANNFSKQRVLGHFNSYVHCLLSTHHFTCPCMFLCACPPQLQNFETLATKADTHNIPYTGYFIVHMIF